LIVRKIVDIAAIRYHILNLKCTKFEFGWGSAPDPTWELTLDLRGIAEFAGLEFAGVENDGRSRKGGICRSGK